MKCIKRVINNITQIGTDTEYAITDHDTIIQELNKTNIRIDINTWYSERTQTTTTLWGQRNILSTDFATWSLNFMLGMNLEKKLLAHFTMIMVMDNGKHRAWDGMSFWPEDWYASIQGPVELLMQIKGREPGETPPSNKREYFSM